MTKTFLVAVLLSSAGVIQGQPKKGKPADTQVIVVLPQEGSSGLTEDGGGRYQTDAGEGVKAILFETDGNLSLQFAPVGKGKNASFQRQLELDLSIPPDSSASPLPDLTTAKPDYLFAAPDQGNGINCSEAEPCCVTATECFGEFGTVTGFWDQVRLSYQFRAEVENSDQSRDWSIRWHRTEAGRFARMACLENESSGRCLVWEITPEDQEIDGVPPDSASVHSSGTGADFQETGTFQVPTKIIVCRAGVSLSQPCEQFLTP